MLSAFLTLLKVPSLPCPLRQALSSNLELSHSADRLASKFQGSSCPPATELPLQLLIVTDGFSLLGVGGGDWTVTV